MSTRLAFVVDVNRCTGCHACEMACQIANGLPADLRWREVVTYNELHVPGVENLHLSLACNHCREAPCLEQCPAAAYRREESTGAVLIDAGTCLGCRYCAWVCPYNAPRFDEARGVMTKCTFCHEKLIGGGRPACVTSCPTEALQWRELTDAELTQDVPGFAQAGTDPSIRIEGLQAGRRVPEQTAPPAMPPWWRLREYLTRHITLTHEWPLAVFTLLAAALVGAVAAGRWGGTPPAWPVLAGLGLSGLALSASHLGRRGRAWRAPLHVRASWLSREIVLFSAFLGLAALALAGVGPAWTNDAAIALGFLALGAMDLVYRPARIRGGGPLHSAQVLGTGLLLAACGSGAGLVAVTVAVVKLVLFAARQAGRRRLGLAAAVGLAVPRLGFLLAGVGWLLTETGAAGYWPAVGLVLIGEAIDRGLFYTELEIETPGSLMLEDLAGRIRS